MAERISCGGEGLVPNCSFCENNEKRKINAWCGEDCYFDDALDVCKEKGNL